MNRMNKHGLIFFIWQLLELVDNGNKITKEEADDWLFAGNIINNLYNRFPNELRIFKTVNTYDYKEVEKIICDNGNSKNLDAFHNGLLGLVNVCQFIVTDESICVVDKTIEEI